MSTPEELAATALSSAAETEPPVPPPLNRGDVLMALSHVERGIGHITMALAVLGADPKLFQAVTDVRSVAARAVDLLQKAAR